MSKNSKLLIGLAMFGVGMFAFGYANVPLFQMFCSAVGIQIQNPDNIVVGEVKGDGEVDTSRELKVLFSTTVNDGLPILFESSKSRVTINPGATDQVDYRFVNLSADTLYFRDHVLHDDRFPRAARGRGDNIPDPGIRPP